ncbi:dTDP-4-amino-4,6-dideoxy-D-glucose acetyltransferase VioB [Sphaerotilus sulfidivorans]
MALLTQKQIEAMGFAAVGKDIRISDRASFYGCSRISLGNHVRIDDFCILSSGTDGITIGSHIHIAAYTSLIGSGKINLQDYCGLSSRVSIYSSSDDYSGEFMTNPMVPAEYTNVTHAPVTIGRHVIIGSGSIVLPGVTLHEGVAIGALSLVSRDCAAFGIYAGRPAKRVKERSRQLLKYEARLQNMLSPQS